jgi:hypothetical protein
MRGSVSASVSLDTIENDFRAKLTPKTHNLLIKQLDGCNESDEAADPSGSVASNTCITTTLQLTLLSHSPKFA